MCEAMINFMLKRYSYVFASSVIYCYAYVGDTDGNACLVYA
jgi:hypothetical protein